MVYLFLGKEQFLKQQTLTKLKSKVCDAASINLNYDEFQAGEDDLNKIIECAKTAPFMAKFRLLVIKEVNRLIQEEKERIVLLITKKSPSVILVLMADALEPSDPIYKTVTRVGKLINFDFLQGNSLSKWITGRFLYFNKRIEPNAIKVLADNAGNSLMRLNLAIELLATFVGNRDEIMIDDVEDLIGKSLEVTTFQLVDTIGAKNVDSALRILHSLDKDAKTALQIIGLIGWHLRRVWRAKKLGRTEALLSKIATSVGIPQYARQSFFRQVNNFSVQELEKGFRILLKLDKDIKSASAQTRRALEILVVQLCAKP